MQLGDHAFREQELPEIDGHGLTLRLALSFRLERGLVIREAAVAAARYVPRCDLPHTDA
jgi:hypothetical protein